jgi:hypothetical protein
VVGVLHAELAEQSEVDMAHFAGRPPVEEVLSVRFDPFEHCAVDTGGVGVEPTLRTGDAHDPAGEELAVISGDAMNRVAFWHVLRERTMIPP